MGGGMRSAAASSKARERRFGTSLRALLLLAIGASFVLAATPARAACALTDLACVTEPVTETADDVTDPVTDVTDPVTGTVGGVVDKVKGTVGPVVDEVPPLPDPPVDVTEPATPADSASAPIHEPVPALLRVVTPETEARIRAPAALPSAPSRSRLWSAARSSPASIRARAPTFGSAPRLPRSGPASASRTS
jgi:hypothetical protein